MNPTNGFFTRRQLAENQMVDLARANVRAASKAGRINTAPRVIRGLDGKPIGGAQSPFQTLTSAHLAREQRVAQSMQNGTFAGIRDRYNRDNPGMWMNNFGSITRYNPYINGGQLGTGPTSTTPPSAAAAQQGRMVPGRSAGSEVWTPAGEKAWFEKGIATPKAAAAAVPGNPAAQPAPAKPAAPASIAPSAWSPVGGGVGGALGAIAQTGADALKPAAPTFMPHPKGRVFDNGVDVTADIQKGVKGDKSGSFYGTANPDARMMSQAQHIQDAAQGIAKAEAANREGQAKLAEIAKQNPYNASATTPPVNSTPTQAPAVPAKPTPVAQTFAGDTRYRTGYQGPVPSYKQVAADTSAARPGGVAIKNAVTGTLAETGAKIKTGADAFTSGVKAVKNFGPNMDDARNWLHGDPEAKKRLAAVTPTR